MIFKNTQKILCYLTFVFFSICSLLNAQNFTQVSNKENNFLIGNIDYNALTLYTEATSSSDSGNRDNRNTQIILQNTAEIKIENNLYYMLTSMIFDSDRKIADVINENPDLDIEILGMMKKSRLLGISYPRRHSITVSMALNLHEENGLNIFKTLYKYSFRYNPRPLVTYFDALRDYDALIIDARELNLTPAIFPTIYDEDGNMIYNVSFVNQSAVEERGLVKYLYSAKDIDSEFRSPYSIVARSKRGYNKCDIVISNNDAMLIFANQGLNTAMKNAIVYVIVD